MKQRPCSVGNEAMVRAGLVTVKHATGLDPFTDFHHIGEAEGRDFTSRNCGPRRGMGARGHVGVHQGVLDASPAGGSETRSSLDAVLGLGAPASGTDCS